MKQNRAFRKPNAIYYTCTRTSGGRMRVRVLVSSSSSSSCAPSITRHYHKKKVAFGTRGVSTFAYTRTGGGNGRRPKRRSLHCSGSWFIMRSSLATRASRKGIERKRKTERKRFVSFKTNRIETPGVGMKSKFFLNVYAFSRVKKVNNVTVMWRKIVFGMISTTLD